VIRQRQPTQPQARRRSDLCRLGPVSRAIADPGAVRRHTVQLAPVGGERIRPLAVYLTPDIQLYLAIGLFFAFVPFETLWRLRFDRPLMMMQQLGLSIVSLI
jgi:hypothetical protein